MADTTIDKPLNGDPAKTETALPDPNVVSGSPDALGSPSQALIDLSIANAPTFDPNLPDVATTEDINKAISDTTELPPEVQASLEVGQVGSVEGQDTVFLRTGQDEIRGFTTPEALFAAGFSFDDVRPLLPSAIEAFSQGVGIDEILATSIPGLLEFQAIEAGIRNLAGIDADEKAIQDSVDTIADLFDALPEARKKARQEAFAEFGVVSAKDALADVKQEIITFEENTDLADEFIRNQSGVIVGIKSGATARLQRNASIKRRTLFSKQAALQGDYANSFNLAQSAIDDATADELARINGLSFLLEQQQATLSRKDARASQALQFQLNERSRVLQEEAADKAQKTNLFLQLQQAYPSADVRPNMTMDEMFAEVQPFATRDEKLALQSQKLSIQQQQASIAQTLRATAQIGAQAADDAKLDKIRTDLYAARGVDPNTGERGGGNFVDINTYERLKSEALGQGVPGATFDNAYALDYLSEGDRKKFDIGSELIKTNSTQEKNAQFADMMVNADTILKPLDFRVAEMNDAEFFAELKKWGVDPVLVTDPDLREYFTFAGQWAEGLIRNFSGAAIREEEYKKNAQQFFTLPGDSDELIQQKQDSRNRLNITTIGAAGGAYQRNLDAIEDVDPLGFGTDTSINDPLGLDI